MVEISDKFLWYYGEDRDYEITRMPSRSDSVPAGYPSDNKLARYGEEIYLFLKWDVNSKVFNYFKDFNHFQFDIVIEKNDQEYFNLKNITITKSEDESNNIQYCCLRSLQGSPICISFIYDDDYPNNSGFYLYANDNSTIDIDADVQIVITIQPTEDVETDFVFSHFQSLEDLDYYIVKEEEYATIEVATTDKQSPESILYDLQKEEININFSIPPSIPVDSGEPKISLNFFVQATIPSLGDSRGLISLALFSNRSGTVSGAIPFGNFISATINQDQNTNFWNVSFQGEEETEGAKKKTFLSKLCENPASSTGVLHSTEATQFFLLPFIYESNTNLSESDNYKKDLINLNRIYFSIILYNGLYEKEFGPYQFPEDSDLVKLIEINDARVSLNLPVRVSSNGSNSFLYDDRISFEKDGTRTASLTGYYRSNNLLDLSQKELDTDNKITWFTVPSSWKPESCVGLIYRADLRTNLGFRINQWGIDAERRLAVESEYTASVGLSFMRHELGQTVGNDNITRRDVSSMKRYWHSVKFKATKSNGVITYQIGIPNKLNNDDASWPDQIYLISM